MTMYDASYVRKHFARELEDFAEEFEFDYTFAAEKMGAFIAEFDVERGLELAWEWAAEYGHVQPDEAYARIEEEEISPERRRIMDEYGMVPGVAYTMGPDGWESDDRPELQY